MFTLHALSNTEYRFLNGTRITFKNAHRGMCAPCFKVLAELQDRLPPFPKDEAIAIIERELGCSVAEVFSFLSEEPVAAASFGQVYNCEEIYHTNMSEEYPQL